jgi:S-adenosyl-L-methionine hydrolase (adenosine-forming)
MNVITLLTDFGLKDYFIGAMKGVILSINPSAVIVDISHEIEPQRIRSAAFVLSNSYHYFPPKTIHVAVVDPGVGSERRAILVETPRYFFIAPDNGLLSFIFENNDETAKIYELTNEEFFLPKVSRTFHGRDIFAPVAAHLSIGVLPEQMGRKIYDPVRFENPIPQKLSERRFIGEIIHIDRFGNLVTNFRGGLPGNFVLRLGDQIVEKHYRFYSEARENEIFSIIGSSEFLEISIFQDSAASRLKAFIGQEVEMLIL